MFALGISDASRSHANVQQDPEAAQSRASLASAGYLGAPSATCLLEKCAPSKLCWMWARVARDQMLLRAHSH